jgi:hypothetical protein
MDAVISTAHGTLTIELAFPPPAPSSVGMDSAASAI